jgi:hypothetical protein
MAKVSIELEARVQDAVASLNEVDRELGQLGGTGRQTGISLTDLKSGVDLAMGAFNAVKGAVESVINPTIEYGKQIRDLGSFAGITAEESSRLIQVTDDLGIEFGTLRTAAKTMAENGIQPSVKNLAELADEFNAIQDPVQQSQFLIDKFGARAGPQMAFALRQGSDAILQLGKDAEATGLVVGEDFVKSTREAELALDEWEDSVLSLKVALSETLLPVVTAFVGAWSDKINLLRTVTEGFMEGEVGAFKFAETLFRMLTPAGIDASDELANLTDATTDYGDKVAEVDPIVRNMRLAHEAEGQALQDEQEALRNSWGQWGTWADAIVQAGEDYAAGLEAANKRAQESFQDLMLIIDGPVGDANDDYYASQKDAGAVIAELTVELEKLRKSHGLVVESTDDGTQAHRNLIIAQADAQTAAENLKKAQEKLAEDPGDLGLQAAVARAETALDKHEGAVAEWGDKVNLAGQDYVINNDAAIEAVELKLEEAQAAYDANATAHEEATARIVFSMLTQKLAMDGFTQEEISFLTDVGEAWDIYDTNTANALRAVDAAVNTHGLNADRVIQQLGDNIRNLPDNKVINIQVNTNYESYGAEPGPGVPVQVPAGPDDNAANAVNGAF